MYNREIIIPRIWTRNFEENGEQPHLVSSVWAGTKTFQIPHLSTQSAPHLTHNHGDCLSDRFAASAYSTRIAGRTLQLANHCTTSAPNVLFARKTHPTTPDHTNNKLE